MQSESPRNARAAGQRATLVALRREAAALQQRAARLTAASTHIERRLAELVERRTDGRHRRSDSTRIAELRELGRESIRLLETAVRRRETLRERIEELERADQGVSVPPATVPSVPAEAPEAEAAAETPAPTPAPEPVGAPGPSPPQPPQPPPVRRQRLEHPSERRIRLPAPLMTALRYVAMTVLGALLVALAFLLTPLPELFGWQIYAVQTGSMEPSIPVGSLIAVQPVPAANLKVGDVITFSDRSRPDVRVTHRIVSLETKDGQRLAVTKGDANNTTDSWNVPVSEAIGRVAFHVPGMGYVLAWLGSTTVKLVALALAGLMLVLPSLRRGHGRQGAERIQETSPERVVFPVRTAAQPPALAPDVPPTRPAASSAATIEPPADDVAEDPDASFDALANEIDALLGRLANGEAPSGRDSRDTAPGRRA